MWAIVLGLLGSLSYLGFVVMLLKSSGQDRQAGFVLLLNLVPVVGCGVWELWRHRAVWRSYTALIFGQFLIMGGMLGVGFGSPRPVITINLIIIGVATGLAGISLVLDRIYQRSS